MTLSMFWFFFSHYRFWFSHLHSGALQGYNERFLCLVSCCLPFTFCISVILSGFPLKNILYIKLVLYHTSETNVTDNIGAVAVSRRCPAQLRTVSNGVSNFIAAALTKWEYDGPDRNLLWLILLHWLQGFGTCWFCASLRGGHAAKSTD